MARDKKIQFNVNQKEYEKQLAYSQKENVSMAEVLRDCIKALDTRG